jgi:hypothetical protein
LPASCWFLAWLTLQPCRWRLCVPPKCRLTFNRLYGFISQKIKLFITTAVRTSNPAIKTYRTNGNCIFIISVVILLSLIMDIQPLCPKKLKAFITWKIMKIGDWTINKWGDEISVVCFKYMNFQDNFQNILNSYSYSLHCYNMDLHNFLYCIISFLTTSYRKTLWTREWRKLPFIILHMLSVSTKPQEWYRMD